MGDEPSDSNRAVPDGVESWNVYWTAQGMPWRTEPDIDMARQGYLAERRTVKTDIETGIYPFRDEAGCIKLNRADVEWLLATHDSQGMIGPVMWEAEAGKPVSLQREGLDLRGADLCDMDVSGLPFTKLRAGLVSDGKPGRTAQSRQFTRWQSVKFWTAVGVLLLATYGGMIAGAIFGNAMQASWATIVYALCTSYLSLAIVSPLISLLFPTTPPYTVGQVEQAAVQFRGSNLRAAQLQEAILCGVNFNRARLEGANLKRARLERAQFHHAHLDFETNLADSLFGSQSVELYKWFLQLPAPSFVGQIGIRAFGFLFYAALGCYISWALVAGIADENHVAVFVRFLLPIAEFVVGLVALTLWTVLRHWLSNARNPQSLSASAALWSGARLADVHWDKVNLAVVDWREVRVTGDECLALQARDNIGRFKNWRTRVSELQTSVRAYRQLTVQLREQGLNEAADEYAFRAHLMQHRVLLRQLKPLQWLGSLMLNFVAGYGYRPKRSIITYVATITVFAALYWCVTNDISLTHGLFTQTLLWLHMTPPMASYQPLQPYEAVVVSMTSFHGRGFFQPVQSPGDKVAILAAIEAAIGLLIEIVFIATFTQRFFAR